MHIAEATGLVRLGVEETTTNVYIRYSLSLSVGHVYWLSQSARQRIGSSTRLRRRFAARAEELHPTRIHFQLPVASARRSGVSSVTLTHDSSHRSPSESSPSHSTSTECFGWQGYNCVLNLTSCELCLCKYCVEAIGLSSTLA